MVDLVCKLIPFLSDPWKNLINKTILPDVFLQSNGKYRINADRRHKCNCKKKPEDSSRFQDVPHIHIRVACLSCIWEIADSVNINITHCKRHHKSEYPSFHITPFWKIIRHFFIFPYSSAAHKACKCRNYQKCNKIRCISPAGCNQIIITGVIIFIGKVRTVFWNTVYYLKIFHRDKGRIIVHRICAYFIVSVCL